MAAFTVILTTSADIGTHVTEELVTEFGVTYSQLNVVDQFVEFEKDIAAKSIAYPIYDLLATSTTPLTETDDPDSIKMSDSEILLTPKEYGTAVTKTRLSDLVTGGRTALGAVRLVATNMANTTNKLGSLAAENTTNILYGGTATSDITVAATDIMSPNLLNKAYNKLSRANVPKHSSTGTYVAMMHEDLLFDLRDSAAAGTWTDVSKYSGTTEVFNNEIGMFQGFRIFRNNDSALTVDAGVGGTVDVYSASFMGANALGLAQSKENEMIIKVGADKMNRFTHISWYGVFEYKLIQPEAVWKARCASSIGANV